MNATVKKITVSTVEVEYEDGSYAIVPIEKGQEKALITLNIRNYHNDENPFDKVSDIPIKAGDVLDLTPPAPEDEDVDYRDARLHHYPRLQKQADAAYWARQGDDTLQKAVDAEIDNVKTKIPKTWTGKQSEIDGLLD